MERKTDKDTDPQGAPVVEAAGSPGAGSVTSGTSMHTVTSCSSMHTMTSSTPMHTVTSSTPMHTMTSCSSMHTVTSGTSMHTVTSSTSVHCDQQHPHAHPVPRVSQQEAAGLCSLWAAVALAVLCCTKDSYLGNF